jgi:hypothetical protein
LRRQVRETTDNGQTRLRDHKCPGSGAGEDHDWKARLHREITEEDRREEKERQREEKKTDKGSEIGRERKRDGV